MNVIELHPPINELSPAKKVEAMRRIKQLETREVVIPMACTFCYSPQLEERSDKYEKGLFCLACGRRNQLSTVKTIRRQRIRRYIGTGVLTKVK